MSDAVKALQQKLNDLGAAPPLVVDGIYGPKLKAAVVAFQKSRGLVPDGIAGPKTLGALGLSTEPSQEAMSYSGDKHVVSGNPSDVNAYVVSKRAAPNMPEAQRQYVLAVARGEGHYGLGWASPSQKTIDGGKPFGLTGTEGAGSNNWGATQGQGDAGSFKHLDFHANGKPYVGVYKRWSTPEKGFQDIANVILGGGSRKAIGAKEIQDAIAKGDLAAAVNAQHANGYFELDPAEYLTAVKRNYAALTDATNWQALFGSVAGVGLGSSLLWDLFGFGAVAGAATAAYIWWRNKRRGIE